MGKKGKKVIKKMNSVQNRREFEKEKERITAIGDLHCLYDGVMCHEDIFKKNCNEVLTNKVKLELIKNLIFNTVILPKDFVNQEISNILMDMTQVGLFASVKPKMTYKKGVMSEVAEEIEKIFGKFVPTLFEETFELYIKTIAIIFEYDKEFCSEITFDLNKFKNWCLGVFEKSMIFTLLKYTDTKMKRASEDSKIVYDAIFNNFMPIEQTDEESLNKKVKESVTKKGDLVRFSSSYFVGLKSEELKNILTEQVNSYYDYIDDKQSKTIDSLIEEAPEGMYPFSYEVVYGESEYDLSTLVKIARTDLKRYKDINFDAFKELSCYDSIQKAVMMVAGLEVNLLESHFIRPAAENRVNAFLKYKDLLLSSNKEKSDKEVKELTSQVRTLKKDFTKLEKSFEEAEKRIQEYEESEKVEIADTQVILDISEVEEYKKTIEKLENQISENKDDYSKISNKSGWQENRIKELEDKLKYYVSLENDMMSLQNEKNILEAQVVKLEEMGQEDEDVKKARFEEHLNAIKDMPILFVGGTGNMMSKFMPLFPNSDYIDISDEGTNFTVPQRFAYVVVYTRVVTHSHCARVESMVDKDKIIPVNIFNTELVVEELYKNIIGHKK